MKQVRITQPTVQCMDPTTKRILLQDPFSCTKSMDSCFKGCTAWSQ